MFDYRGDPRSKRDDAVYCRRRRSSLIVMRKWRVLVLLIACLSTLSGVTHAQELIDRRNQSRREQRAPQNVSLGEAVQMAQSRYRAKAVRAETVNNGGRRVHQIRLLSAEGKVWMVRIDAETGAMY